MRMISQESVHILVRSLHRSFYLDAATHQKLMMMGIIIVAVWNHGNQQSELPSGKNTTTRHMNDMAVISSNFEQIILVAIYWLRDNG